MSIIYLAGNPNSGKTSLFNRLTNSRYQVGNRAGVTVSERSGAWGNNTLFDLPGIYSLSGSSAEERLSADFLTKGNPDWILNIADASQLERSLALTCELGKLGHPMALALNLCDLLEKNGQRIDAEKLSKILGIPVVLISAATGQGILELSNVIPKKMNHKIPPIPEMIKSVQSRTGENRILQKTEALDRAFLHSIFAIPILLCTFFLMFYLTFGAPGNALSSLLQSLPADGFERILDSLGTNYFLKSLIIEGIFPAISGMAAFFPQLLLLFFFLAILEDSGYFARMIFLSHRAMERLGLDGHCILPLLSGFGCSATAILSSRVIRDAKKRRKTIFMIPYLPCSAKLPVTLMLIHSFFPAHTGLAVTLFYLAGILSAFVYALITRRIYAQESVFLLELPPYRMPSFRNVSNQIRDRLSDFFRRAGMIVLLTGILLWLLQSFDFSLHFCTPNRSMLAYAGNFFAPVFRPCGFGNWESVVSLFSGLAAKEAVLSSFGVLFGSNLPFTPASAASFLTFLLIAPPCAAALSVFSSELSRRDLILFCAQRLLIAWLCSAAVYQIACFLA